MNDKRQGSEKAFKTDENTEISCKIDDIEPVETAAGPGVLQNNLAPEWTYFIRDAEGIKIGRSIQPRARMRSLQAGNGSKMELLLAVPSERLSEPEAHRKFRHLRTHLEWHRPEPELLDFIEALKSEVKKPIRLARRANVGPIVGKLHALRGLRGANTPIGHGFSNIAQQMLEMKTYVRPVWATDIRQTLPWMLEQQMKRVERLKALDN